MYTFSLTMCGLIALLGGLALVLGKLLDGIIEEDEGDIDYGRE